MKQHEEDSCAKKNNNTYLLDGAEWRDVLEDIAQVTVARAEWGYIEGQHH